MELHHVILVLATFNKDGKPESAQMSCNCQSSFSRGLIECTNRAKESVGDLICNLERAFDGRLREKRLLGVVRTCCVGRRPNML
jgi:hypothetical protein